MPISGIPLFSMLRTKMQWHQERQRLLAENVSNADTPKFRPRDLAPLRFDSRMTAASGAGASGMGAPAGAVVLARTDPGHLGASAGSAVPFQPDRKGTFEVRPAGNAVTLEDEMLKVAANQMDYQAATTLYGRSLGLLKTAIGKR
jgi:flagellar basal-body rod protein FlgB